MPIHVNKYNHLHELPNEKYEGYFWLSDQKEPHVLFDEDFNAENIPSNAFVVEALLYSKEKNVSIHIQHHGEYLIRAFNMTELQSDEAIEREFIPHNRLKSRGVKKCNFIEYWQEETDADTFPVLVLKATIFKGFKK